MWDVIANVTTGVTLAAFVAAVTAWVIRGALVRRERLIRSAPEDDRAPLVEAALESFRIDTTGLTRNQKYSIVMEQIQAREKRFMAIAKVVTLTTALLAGVAIYTIAHSGPHPQDDQPVSPGLTSVIFTAEAARVGDSILLTVTFQPPPARTLKAEISRNDSFNEPLWKSQHLSDWKSGRVTMTLPYDDVHEGYVRLLTPDQEGSLPSEPVKFSILGRQ